jgi:uncharacterized surface protein with fasciclin (FAS1) repeats
MKNKVKDSILLTVCDLPSEQIEGLGLSFKSIGRRCFDITKEYLSVPANDGNNVNQTVDYQKILRRGLSNWVNDPKNLVNSKGEYIGDKFGARITICTSDGYVTHDVETFCRDVKNKNARFLGKNNNYIEIKQEISNTKNDDKFNTLFSTLSNKTPTTNTLSNDLYTVRVIKYKSSLLPSNKPISDNDLKYLLKQTDDNVEVTILSGTVMDKHTTRKEIIQASCGRYGFDSRISETTFNNNWYVCKKWSYKNGYSGSILFCRLSYFKFPEPTIIDRLVADSRFKKLFAAVKAAELVETLSGAGPFTVFAPTDDAFKKFAPAALEALLADVDKLRKLLTYHVVPGKVMAADVVKLSFAKTLDEGLNVSIRVDKKNNVFINDSQVTITDITCANGVIHVIDTVLSEKTTYDLLVGSNKFNKFISALNAVDLDEVLSGDTNTYTVFAPTDDAFKKFAPAALEALLADVDKLRKLLTYHVVPGKVMAADIIKAIDDSGTTYMTLAEQSISVSMKNGDITINDSAKVTITDVLGSNDVVVHVIDTVLDFQTIYQLLKANKKFEEFITAVEAAKLTPLLSGPEPEKITVFAPFNEAFQIDDQLDLELMIKNHLLNRAVNELPDDEFIHSIAGFSVHTDKNGEDFVVNNANIISDQIRGSNGVAHMVDKAVLPLSLYEMLSITDSLTRFADFIDNLPLTKQQLIEAQSLTLIAPQNDSFQKNAWPDSLPLAKKDIFANSHMASGSKPIGSQDIIRELGSTNSQYRVDNLAGSRIKFTKTEQGEIKVNGTKFNKLDIICSNGTLHISKDFIVAQADIQ